MEPSLESDIISTYQQLLANATQEAVVAAARLKRAEARAAAAEAKLESYSDVKAETGPNM